MFEPTPEKVTLNLSELKLSVRNVEVYIDVTDANTDNPDIDDPHIHDCYEVYLNLTGNVSFFVKNHIFPITHGDMIITRPNELHQCIYKKSCQHNHICLWFTCDTKSEIAGVFSSNNIWHLSPDVATKETVIATLNNLNNAIQSGNRLETTAMFLIFLSLVQKELVKKPSLQKPDVPKEFQYILDYINLNYGEISGIKELYNRFFVSPSTLNRWFLKHLQTSPKTYLEHVKLSNAKRLLNEGKSVTTVCFECGYSDCSHFISVFKNKFGKTPLQYKNENE